MRGAYSGVPLSFNPAQVEAFWAKWEALALRRKNALLSQPSDWDEVVSTMREANMLLSEAPDYKLRRLARLTRLPPDSDLTMEDRFIYVLWGPFPFYGVYLRS